MDKVREEFEAWVKSIGGSAMKRRDGVTIVYVESYTDHLWKAWKASRAALCVELPKTPSFSASDEPDLAFEEGVDVMKVIIEAVGVTCK